MRFSALFLTLALLLGCPSETAWSSGDLVVLVYDVRDLLHPPKDFPAPRLGLKGIEETEDPFGDDEEDTNGPVFTADELVEMIEIHIQPERWGVPGNSVRVHKGQLIIVADSETHTQVSKNISRWRWAGLPSTFTVQTRAIAADAALLKALGFKKTSKRNSRPVDAETLQKALAQRAAEPHRLPSRTVLEGQSSPVFPAELSARVADAEKTGQVEPTVEGLTRGVTFEATVRKRGSKRVLVTWRAQVARATGSEPERLHGAEIELPEVEIRSLHGRSVVKRGRTLAIAGLPHPDGKTEGEFVWLVDITPVKKKRREAKL